MSDVDANTCLHLAHEKPWRGAAPAVQVAGGRTMRLRDNDPAYLAHVDRWWAVLFGRLRRLLYQNGGPIVMVQVRIGLASLCALGLLAVGLPSAHRLLPVGQLDCPTAGGKRVRLLRRQ